MVYCFFHIILVPLIETCMKANTSSNQRLSRTFEDFRRKVAREKSNRGRPFGSPDTKQKFSNFSACKAQGNQHKIRIAKPQKILGKGILSHEFFFIQAAFFFPKILAGPISYPKTTYFYKLKTFVPGPS